MSIPITIDIEGFSKASVPDMSFDLFDLEMAASWCGSYDILEMGRHFDAYVMMPRSVLLPPIAGFPTGRRFTRLPGKWPAPSVHGNIGEAVAALMAVERLGFRSDGVAHIKGAVKKTPDFLLKVTDQFKELVENLSGMPIPFPSWIPCEAKCRKTQNGVKRAVKEAVSQLQSYWDAVPANENGYGIVCCFLHAPPQSIWVKILIPPEVVEEFQAALSKLIPKSV